MANEITFGYTTGRDLAYGVYQPNGAVRTAAGTDLPEIPATGYYTATNASIVSGDFVIVTDSVLGVVGQGEYQPEVATVPTGMDAIEDKIDIIDENVDTLLEQEAAVLNVYNETGKTPTPSGNVATQSGVF